MRTTRRQIIKGSAALAALGIIPRPLYAHLGEHGWEPAPPIEDPRLAALTSRSLDAARGAGASYADVRLTHTYSLRPGGLPEQEESMSFGIRALVNGYWGFATSPLWSIDEAARLGRTAVQHAKANTLGKIRPIELAPLTPVRTGHWTTPIKVDPFEMNLREIEDFISSLRLIIQQLPGANPLRPDVAFVKQEKVFASTAGHYCTQRTYRTSAVVGFELSAYGKQMAVSLDSMSPAGAGYEYLHDQDLREQLRKLYDETLADLSLPMKPVDVGRYDVVFDAASMTELVSKTVGAATEVDRALGYEANAGGTSYINDPLEMIGTFKMGGPLLTVTADRSAVGAAATVKWDDEGIEPEPFTLVKDGILADMQTSRESAGWLKPRYERRGERFRSHGCAAAPDAMFAPLTHTANLTMVPGRDAVTFESLVAQMTKGIMFKRVQFDMDYQQISGLSLGTGYEIKEGKRIAMVRAAGILFRSTELWNSLTHIGGPGTSHRSGRGVKKGQPEQTSYHSVTAVPAAFKGLSVIDIGRKA